LAYLSQYTNDSRKIARSFISTIGNSSEGSALTRMLIELGKALGLETLAEGIEDQSQYAQLQAAHCDSGQGFLMARPLDAEALDAFLAVQAAELASSAV